VAAFKSGETDGVMGPQGELQGLLAEQPVPGVLFHTEAPVGQMRTAWDVGVAVRSSRSTGLRDAVASILDALKHDGSLQKVFAAHGVKYVDAAAAVAGKEPSAMRVETITTQGES
jgi:ABC-type amino acid transport substrate-binding protein